MFFEKIKNNFLVHNIKLYKQLYAGSFLSSKCSCILQCEKFSLSLLASLAFFALPDRPLGEVLIHYPTASLLSARHLAVCFTQHCTETVLNGPPISELNDFFFSLHSYPPLSATFTPLSILSWTVPPRTP